MNRRELIALLTAAPCVFADDDRSILGTGWGLDHIEIAVRSGEEATETYFTKLGFTVSGATNAAPGVQHSGILFSRPYVEFIWLGGPGEPDLTSDLGLQLKRSLDRGGGIFQYNIDVSGIEGVQDRLTRAGLKVQLTPGTQARNGKEQPANWRFLYATDDRTGSSPPFGVPGGGEVGIIEYRNNSDPARLERLRRGMGPMPGDPRRGPGEDHANTAQRLNSVLVAVPDTASAVKECAAFGFAAVRKMRSSTLEAVGQQVACGQGFIDFWQPASRKGPLSSMLSQNGPGPFGFSVSVANLETARRLAEEGLKAKLRIERGGTRESFYVSGRSTAGVWIQFVRT